MFSIDRFVEECRAALGEGAPQSAIKELTRRAVSSPAQVAREVGPPEAAGLFPLYRSDELTILNVVWAPDMTLYPHDHRMWAVIGVYEGCEDNAFFKRTAQGVAPAARKRLEAGDAVALGEPAIHAVTNPLGRFTCALQIYSGDFFGVARSEFDPLTLQERPFDVERARRVFSEAAARHEARLRG
jgi:predicted metal-dependent enzyme (double-stranded beta helix superfamily)